MPDTLPGQAGSGDPASSGGWREPPCENGKVPERDLPFSLSFPAQGGSDPSFDALAVRK